MRNQLLYLFAFTLIFASCTKDKIDEIIDSEPMSEAAINEIVFEKLNQHQEFRWSMVDDHMVWSALVKSDKILSIGYKPADVADVHSIIHEVDINDEKWTAARNKVLEVINETLKDDPNFDPSEHIYIKKVLPAMILYTDNYELIKKLRAIPELVRYVEPMGYGIEPDINNNPSEDVIGRSDSGCGSPSTASGVSSSDYYNLPPYNNKVPWTYSAMNIDDAWSYSTGNNVTVAMFDTGTSNDQTKLRSGFNNNYSSGRYISPRSTHYTTTGSWWWSNTTLDSPHDQCGHGTQMAGTIAAPRSSGSSIVGVAYKANLLAYRVSEDVIINASHEKDGVSDAFVEIAQEGDAKIVSMSLGDVFSSGQVEDAVVYAYNRGVLIFAAGGTSLSWTSWYGVIFPANLPQTVAITGVTDEYNYERCDVCHDGSAIDFVVKMERTTTRRSMTLKMSGNSPAWVGGSSTATAHAAGVAALIKARYPWYSRNSIYNKMKYASENYPYTSSSFGYGTVDALQAVQ